MPSQCSRSGIVAREPIRCGSFPSPMVRDVQDGRFFPKASLQFQGDNVALPVREYCWNDSRHHWLNQMMACRLLVCKGAELKLDRSFQVLESCGLDRRVMK